MKRNRPPIEHIVVLMMENHSYDNYLGMLQCRGEGGLERTPGPVTLADRAVQGSPRTGSGHRRTATAG
ncbi:MAG TPA: alkaline phosphatase family protein [Streptosporangiaceae bacterium]